MKNLLTAALPALALLALGGCATTGAVTSTEDDGVYYSSKDRTTVAQAPATGYQSGGYSSNGGYGAATTTTPQAPAGENANPDYQGGTAQSGTASGTDYYDDSYSYNSVSPSGFGQPYTGPGVSSYNYTPNWSVSPSYYGSPYGYGSALSIGYGYGAFGGYSPFGYGYGYPAYGFYDPFYSPFYSPWGYGSGFSIGFGYGFGGFGYPYYSGYGYPGYAYGYPYGGYGGGYYGDYGYGGARNYVYKQNIVNGGYSNGYNRDGAILVGRRESRATNAVGNGNLTAPGNAAVGTSIPSGRQANGGAAGGFNRVMAPGSQPATGFAGSTPTAPAAGRGQRFEQATTNPNSPATNGVSDGRGWGRMSNNANGNYNQPRTADMAAPAGAAAAPDARRGGGFFRGMFSAPANQGGSAGNQGGFSQPQRSYSQPADRGFSQPRMEQRSFQPAPSPSFGGSRGGSFGGGGGGGGSFGGGGGGGGGRRGR